jgi:hypothetical protein
MMNGRPFGEIGFAYARRFADIESARELFTNDRDACLARLRAALGDAIGNAKTDYDVVGPHGENGLVYAKHLASRYAAARKRRGKGGTAGVQFELGPLDVFGHRDAFGFAATAYFGMGRPQYRRLTEQSGALVECAHVLHGGYMYAWQEVVPLGEADDAFTERALFDAVAPTLALYLRLDQTFAERVDAEAGDVRADDESP